MLSFDEGEDVFFDSADYLSSEEPVVAKEDLVCDNLGYEIWMNEPLSVKERRESFLRGMGFIEFTPLRDFAFGKVSEIMGFERIVECSGAVSNSCGAEEDLVCNSRELYGAANLMVDELGQDQVDKLNVVTLEREGETACVSTYAQQFGRTEAHGHVEECRNFSLDRKKLWSWWKHLINKRKGNRCTNVSEVSNPIAKTPKVNRMKVRQNKKRCLEFTAVYIGQEIHAHEGFIRTMKFSSDGQYLASGGKDGVVRIWRVRTADASGKNLYSEGNFGSPKKEANSNSGRKKSSHASIVIPDELFQIDESPLHEFHGHTSDVLDLAWSKSNCLLSSSEDKTVRLWQVGCDECLSVFQHNDYVTCIQFNPADENYFISGSLDGKVRVWGLSKRRVVDWTDIRDVVTAICYQPNGKGFIVSSITGSCRFYEATGSNIQLNAEIHFQGRKKSSGKKITGIQFSLEDSQRVMITSEGSKLHILDGIDVVQKYKGRPKSGSQMSASFTSTGRHIISVGEDSHVYVWNYDLSVPPSKQKKSIRSCEHFFFEGVSVAIPWSGMGTEQKGSSCGSLQCCLQTQEHQEASSCIKDSERFSLANWFSMDGSCKGSSTWPEEKLPSLWDVPVAENDHQIHNSSSHTCPVLSATWGLVIVTAGLDGMIRTFHNYGLPVRI
ncbi:hypothetical protein F0562_005745 [Nyssa sinensis]|uniref:Uncharacterized protein n=1 Tax=Nyssa sinensis TaxID=561372 RepID=A0A5J5AMY0_9ASTE|nr:hypothetical protein F0562_005745 [Nyssa sinensis]